MAAPFYKFRGARTATDDEAHGIFCRNIDPVDIFRLQMINIPVSRVEPGRNKNCRTAVGMLIRYKTGHQRIIIRKILTSY